ncbi:DUF2066 domain-containing protein [Marinobacter sp.]|uniref:DUF2066 domain-containing protein n=1 Tax=Marinobacter sp. TaxID=50741 RepID=UPI0019DE38CA|nr:DUF2066 domain-containing protein [Marinobacter sp.]MBE0485223.1 DUF2066 domain-containing protein [Marinobacter sp.]
MTESERIHIRMFKGAAAVVAAIGLLVGLAAPASAVTVSGLYNADVAVAGSGPDDLRAGYAEGLRRVMVRVSGSRDVLAMDGVDEVLSNAESLLLAYQVRRNDGETRMQMSFGAVGVNRALASISAPVWGANRPLTLAWVAVEDRGDRKLITAASEGADREEEATASWRKHFLAAAEERGLPVAFPSSSVQGDRALLSDLWGQFTGRIREASADMSHDALALMRVSRSGGQWRAGWVFDGMSMGSSEQSVTAASPEELARAVVGRWADAYASRYAVAAGEVGDSPRVDIVLEGVNSLADYGNVNKALSGFTPVVSVGASRVRNERLTVQVTFTGELDQLRQYIALDPRFVVMDAQPEEASLPRTVPATGALAEPQPVSELAGSDAQNPEAALFVYQPLLDSDEQDAEQAFESLYQVLYYRWQPAPVVSGGSD